MFGFTAKITKKRIIMTVMLISIPLLVILAVKLSDSPQNTYDTTAKTTAQRLDFLSNFGWECDEKSEQVKDFVIPTEFDKVYSSYNDIQLSQGFDLTKYSGKSVKIYTYKILNYPENSQYVYGSITVYENKIIAGDIHSTALDGFMHGFNLENTGKSFD